MADRETDMDHLACFSGGMYGLAGYDAKQNPTGHTRLEVAASLQKSKHWIKIGAEITEICHESYEATPTKLGPEFFHINNIPGQKLIESGKVICTYKLHS